MARNGWVSQRSVPKAQGMNPTESKCWMELLLKAVEKMQDLHDENVATLGQLFFDVRIPSSFRYTDTPWKN